MGHGRFSVRPRCGLKERRQRAGLPAVGGPGVQVPEDGDTIEMVPVDVRSDKWKFLEGSYQLQTFSMVWASVRFFLQKQKGTWLVNLISQLNSSWVGNLLLSTSYSCCKFKIRLWLWSSQYSAWSMEALNKCYNHYYYDYYLSFLLINFKTQPDSNHFWVSV